MQEKFFVYLRGALEMSDTLFGEHSAASDADAQRHLDALREAIAPLALLREDVTVPDGLAFHTCQRVLSVRQERIE